MIAGPHVATLASRNRADSPSGGRRDGTLDAATFRSGGRVPAVLVNWVRSHDGAWYGLLGRLELHDGAGARRVTVEQLLVPAAALAPRDDPPTPA